MNYKVMKWVISKNTKKYIIPAMIAIMIIILLFAPNFVSAQVACSWSVDCWFQQAMFGIAKVILGIGSWVASAGGAFLDITIKFTLNTATYNLSGIQVGWEIFRDLANMAFIFILLYIAFMTVLQIGGIQTKRLVTHVIVAALLVNFSFFFTGVVIDVGNVIGGFIYNTLVPTPEQTLGNTLSTALNISTIFGPETVGITRPLLFAFLGFGFFVTAGFVFIAAGLMFIQRTVVLMFVLISSPIAFAAAVLPAGPAQALWKKWVGALVGNTFVLPVFLVLLSVIFLIIVDDSIFGIAGTAVPSDESLGNLLDTERADYTVGSSAGILMNFVILIGLLVAALSISKSVGGGISNFTAKAAGKIVGFGAGAGAYAGRKLIGGSARKIIESKGFNKWASESKIGKHLETGLTKTASAGFDLRNIGGAKTAAGFAGVTLGKGGGKGGNLAIQERKRKRQEGQEKRLRERTEIPTDLESRELGQIKADRKKKLEDPRKELETAEKEYRKALKKTDKAGQDSAKHVWLRAQDSLSKAEAAFGEDLKNIDGGMIKEGEKTKLTRLRKTSSGRGQQTKEAYAETLSRRAEVGVRGHTIPLWYVSKARQDTADKLRKGTTTRDKFLSAATDYQKEQENQQQPQGPNV